MKRIILLFTFLLMLTGSSFAQTDKPMLFRQPTVSKTQIVFVFAGDLWIVGREGGVAERLTTGVGTETNPLFSPDGSMVAFTGEYDGNVDIYVVPATGGVPKRITYHPGVDRLLNWTPDGKQILFASGRNSASGRYEKLFTVSLDGTLPTELPLPMGHEGSYSADSSHLAYVPIPRAFANWKRYRGGTAGHLWIDPACKQLIADCRAAVWPSDLEPQHCLSWLRYFCEGEFPVLVDQPTETRVAFAR